MSKACHHPSHPLVALLLGALLAVAGCAASRPHLVPVESAPVALEAPSPVEPAPRHEPFRVAVIADINGRYGSTDYGPEVHRAVARLVSTRPDLVLIAGDMVAGQKAGLDYDAMWAGFHAAVTEPLTAAGIPIAVTPGNHDASGYPGFVEERGHYAATWTERRPPLQFVEEGEFPFYYAFTMHDVLFVSLDVTVPGRLAPQQRDWLLALFARYPDQAKVVFAHLPLHPFAEGRERDTLNDPELEALMQTHGVTAVISGHHQAYFPGRRGNMKLIGTGCLGGGVRRLLGALEPSMRTIITMEFEDGSLTTLEATTGYDFDQRVEHRRLPLFVGRGSRAIVRDDVDDRVFALAQKALEIGDAVAAVTAKPEGQGVSAGDTTLTSHSVRFSETRAGTLRGLAAFRVAAVLPSQPPTKEHEATRDVRVASEEAAQAGPRLRSLARQVDARIDWAPPQRR